MRVTNETLRGRWLLLMSAAALLWLAGSIGTASAGNDPYGSTIPPSEPQPSNQSCAIDQSEGRQGGRISGVVQNVETGARLEFFLGGTKIGDLTVAGSPSAQGSRSSQTTTDATFSFTIPSTLAPGEYSLVVSGSAFNTTCVTPGGGVEFAVLAAGASGPLPFTDGDPLPSADGGPLAFTGANIFVLAALGLALTAIGTLIVRAQRSRRRHGSL